MAPAPSLWPRKSATEHGSLGSCMAAGWAGGGDTTVAYTANATLKASNRAAGQLLCVCVCERERERRNVLKMAFGNFCVSTSYQSMTGGMMVHATYTAPGNQVIRTVYRPVRTGNGQYVLSQYLILEFVLPQIGRNS